MATDEQKNRDDMKRDDKKDNLKDLSAKKLNRDEEERVKGGGGVRPEEDLT
ncbi:MAG: hypothetical protein H0W30_18750 [Gemmatimonadaceae bacterium]|nr:hypothetical protein [Gemmatimonadaceae bacterium]MDQ3517164.1 hypothetical protein [Gemmatimonadota bacterium]